MDYIDGIMNYTGSKFKLLNQLLPKFDYNKTTFVDLFTGGGSVYINILEKYDKIIINDIIEDIIKVYEEISISDDIINKTKLISPNKSDKDSFLDLRKSFNENKSPEKLWALILSCNSNLMRFNQSGEFNQTWGNRTWNKNTDKKVEIFKREIRKYKDKIEFYSTNFKNIEIKENMFFYIDPPYGYIVDEFGNMGNKQISEAGYNNFYYKEDDLNLYNYCHEINNSGSTFMMSGVLVHGGKKSWILNKLIEDGFKCQLVKFDYNKINKSKKDKETKEVIVTNY